MLGQTTSQTADRLSVGQLWASLKNSLAEIERTFSKFTPTDPVFAHNLPLLKSMAELGLSLESAYFFKADRIQNEISDLKIKLLKTIVGPASYALILAHYRHLTLFCQGTGRFIDNKVINIFFGNEYEYEKAQLEWVALHNMVMNLKPQYDSGLPNNLHYLGEIKLGDKLKEVLSRFPSCVMNPQDTISAAGNSTAPKIQGGAPQPAAQLPQSLGSPADVAHHAKHVNVISAVSTRPQDLSPNVDPDLLEWEYLSEDLDEVKKPGTKNKPK